MSDTPSPTPEITKPKLSLTPKAPLAPAPAPAEPAASQAATDFVPEAASSIAPKASPGLQNESGAKPPALVSSGLKPAFKLQGPVHAANPDKFEKPAALVASLPADSDTPSGAIIAMSAIAAAAALTFAVLLFLKNQ